MAVTLCIDHRDKVFAVISDRSQRFVGQHQPVMPVADYILQFLECRANGQGVSVFGSGLCDVARLLCAFAEVVQIVGIELLHLMRETDKGFERNQRSAARTTARAAALFDGGREVRCQSIEFREIPGGFLFQFRGVVLARVMQPCIKMLGLLLDGCCGRVRSFGRWGNGCSFSFGRG